MSPSSGGKKLFVEHEVFGLEGFAEVVSEFGEEWVYRGQAKAEWPLVSSLDRVLKQPCLPNREQRERFEAFTDIQIEVFRDAAEGRLSTKTADLTSDELLAIGQHYGLKTPLLDWTQSVFLALFFAIEDASEGGDAAVWCASRTRLQTDLAHVGRAPALTTIRTSDNQRILAQRGLFSRLRGGGCLACLVQEEDKARGSVGSSKGQALVKLTVKEAARPSLAKALAHMNLSHLSLYPDIIGAAQYANYKLTAKLNR